MEWPTRCARPAPRASSTPVTASASTPSVPSPTSLAEVPCPGRSSAYTRYFAASGSCRNSQEFRSPPYPWTSRITSPSCAGPGVADLAPADVGRLELGAPAGVVGHARVDHRARLEHGGVEGVVADLRRGDQRDRAADRHVLTDPGDDAAHRPGVGGLQRAGDLLRLDVRQVVADLHLVPLRDGPRGDLAELHRQAPLRHRHGDDPVIGQRDHPVTVLTAFTTRCASGM